MTTAWAGLAFLGLWAFFTRAGLDAAAAVALLAWAVALASAKRLEKGKKLIRASRRSFFMLTSEKRMNDSEPWRARAGNIKGDRGDFRLWGQAGGACAKGRRKPGLAGRLKAWGRAAMG